MRILALVKSLEHVCSRYRVAAFRNELELAGHQLDILPWPKSWLSCLTLPHRLRQADAVLIQRKLIASWQLRMLRRQVRWLIYDFDDSVFLRNSYDPRGPHCPRRQARFNEVVQAADLVIAGNEFLSDCAAEYTDREKIHVIPTCVDPDRYNLAPHDDRRVRLVWIGSSSTLNGLEIWRPTLEMLGDNLPEVQLKIICDRSLELKRLRVEFCPWLEESEAREISQCDIGISWLPDDHWSEGKCGLKILQYMAAGLPVVANAVGVHRTLIQPGENGFLAESPDQWLDAVRLLSRDPALRRRMGAAGRRLIETSYGTAHGATSWTNALDQISSTRVLTPQPT